MNNYKQAYFILCGVVTILNIATVYVNGKENEPRSYYWTIGLIPLYFLQFLKFKSAKKEHKEKSELSLKIEERAKEVNQEFKDGENYVQ